MKFILICAAMIILTGCSTAPEPVLFDNSRVYDKSRAQVWQELETFFKSSSIPVISRNEKKGILLAKRNLQRKSIYAECGSSELASVRDGVLTVKISLHSLAAQKTRATIDVSFSAFRRYASIAKTRIECFSNGTLEEEIFKNL